MKAADFCRKAADLIEGDRARQHGDKRQNHWNIARLWAAWLGVPITGYDVAAMMVLLKLARTKTGFPNDDDFTDAAGYAGIMGELMDHHVSPEDE